MKTEQIRRVFTVMDPIDGFHEMEQDMLGPHIWTAKRFKLMKTTGDSLFSLHLLYLGRNGKLSVRDSHNNLQTLMLFPGWNTYPLDLTQVQGPDLMFELNEVVPVEGDSRELGVMIRKIAPVKDYALSSRQDDLLANKVLNESEFLQGRTLLDSFPPRLRIDLESRCNMLPRCVYCGYDRAKEGAGKCDFSYTPESLLELEEFFTLAEEIVDCSVGEPLLNRDMYRFAERFGQWGKWFEMTVNGLLLGKRNREAFLGKRIMINVSIDSATREGYARYRNDRFDLLIRNLKELCREKQENEGLPIIVLAFIVMRSNRNEIGSLLDLAEQIGLDAVKLRTLNYESNTGTVRERNGFTFDYSSELLEHDELSDVIEPARSVARDKGILLYVEMDHGSDRRQGDGPLCIEPWKALYPLRRGIKPCCFSHLDVAKWTDRGDRSVRDFLADIWNGPKYQEIRAGLAAGKLPGICLQCPSCPIVKSEMKGKIRT